VIRLERTNRRLGLVIVALAGVLGGSMMAGARQPTPASIEGFSAVMDRAGGLSYFRLMSDGYVETLDTSRGDRWFWRRIRNWPGHR
jgi:hypothetical protein